QHFKIKSGRYQEAAQDYEQLVKVDPLDTQAISGLVSAYSHYDIEKAEQYETSLPEINSSEGIVPMDIDVNSIERIVPGVKKSYYKKLMLKVHKKKKKRKPLLPRSYDPSVPPDPERWLPKRERSSFKVKGKRKQQLMKGSQGVAVSGGGIGGTGSANISGKSVVSDNQATANTAQSTTQSQPPKPKSGDSKNKKKKKKGNKW
ncbi:hypothetical protein C2S52_023334, partial [Perilla frutescens var. hirtella]